MTLTVKDAPAEASPGKAGSPSQNPVNASNQSPRSNPVCLEVPVVVRSLPGEQGTAPGASGPSREEGRTVIVFDNGAVLRISNQLPPGQKVIVSNQQGRDVVCRVTGGRTPNKGYIEIEFMEPVVDFWNIHLTSEPVSVPPPAPPVVAVAPATPAAPPVIAAPPVQAAPPAAAPATSHLDDLAKELNVSSGSAPTFEDVAGLVPMSPPAVASQDQKEKKIEKRVEPASYSANLKSNDELATSLTETGRYISSSKTASSTSESRLENLTTPEVREASSFSTSTQALSGNIIGKGLLASAYISPASSAGESRSRMPLIAGGAALVLVGFGAGYFLMHRGGTPAAAPVAVSSAVSAPASSAANSAPAPAGQPAVDQPPAPAAPPISTTMPVTAAASAPASADSQNARRPVNTADARQADRSSARRQSLPNLNMSAPSAPKQNPVKFTDGPALSPLDVNTTVAAGGASSGALLPSVVRTENQPAPPPGSSFPASKTVREPKLLTSTRPVYPPMAKQTNVQGSVIVSATVDLKGNVMDAKVVSGPPLLRQAALETVKEWKYSPALIDGRPATASVTVSLDFRLK